MIGKVCTAVLTLGFLVNGAATADTFGTGDNQFTVHFVTVSGGPGPSEGYGNVENDYRIGVYEITIDQWNKFEASLGVPVTGNPPDSYNEGFYWTGPSIPVNGVSWYEAAQFVNWLNTSTGHHAAYRFVGTQGTADYTFDTWSPAEAAQGTNLYRHKDAFYFLPTEDEWVRAAYWNGTNLQQYANASLGDLVSGEPDPSGWNYLPSLGNEPWNVGSGFEELNGTFDMMGNITEWMESPLEDPTYGAGSYRTVLGGMCYSGSYALSSSDRDGNDPRTESDDGFRVAAIVPEPATMSLLALGLGALALRKRKGWRR